MRTVTINFKLNIFSRLTGLLIFCIVEMSFGQNLGTSYGNISFKPSLTTEKIIQVKDNEFWNLNFTSCHNLSITTTHDYKISNTFHSYLDINYFYRAKQEGNKVVILATMEHDDVDFGPKNFIFYNSNKDSIKFNEYIIETMTEPQTLYYDFSFLGNDLLCIPKDRYQGYNKIELPNYWYIIDSVGNIKDSITSKVQYARTIDKVDQHWVISDSLGKLYFMDSAFNTTWTQKIDAVNYAYHTDQLIVVFSIINNVFIVDKSSGEILKKIEDVTDLQKNFYGEIVLLKDSKIFTIDDQMPEYIKHELDLYSSDFNLQLVNGNTGNFYLVGKDNNYNISDTRWYHNENLIDTLPDIAIRMNNSLIKLDTLFLHFQGLDTIVEYSNAINIEYEVTNNSNFEVENVVIYSNILGGIFCGYGYYSNTIPLLKANETITIKENIKIGNYYNKEFCIYSPSISGKPDANISDNSVCLFISATKDFSINESDLKVFPNPTSNVIRIDATSNGSYSIYNTLGALIESGKNTGNEINVENIIPGVYILVIDFNGKALHKTFVKQ